jgi:hypothetical protein
MTSLPQQQTPAPTPSLYFTMSTGFGDAPPGYRLHANHAEFWHCSACGGHHSHMTGNADEARWTCTNCSADTTARVNEIFASVRSTTNEVEDLPHSAPPTPPEGETPTALSLEHDAYCMGLLDGHRYARTISETLTIEAVEDAASRYMALSPSAGARGAEPHPRNCACGSCIDAVCGR